MRLQPWTEIEPGEEDTLGIDFTKEVAAATPVSTVWVCSVAPDSRVPDPNPQNVLNGAPQPDASNPCISKQSVIGRVDGCTYVLDVSLTLDDGRVLKNWSTLPCVSPRRHLSDSGLWR